MDPAKQAWLKSPSKQALVKFGRNVRARRLALGLSQEELAFNCDLDRSYMGSVERGERNISLMNIVKIAKALDVEPEVLLKKIT